MRLSPLVRGGRKGGRSRSQAKTQASQRNGLHGGRPASYRLVDGELERYRDGRWLTLSEPYDAAAKAYLKRHR